MPLVLSDYVVALPLCIVSLVLFYQRRTNKQLPYPPGPPRWPLIGSLLSMPTDENWKEFSNWGDQYGDYTLHVSCPGHPLLTADNSEKATSYMLA